MSETRLEVLAAQLSATRESAAPKGARPSAHLRLLVDGPVAVLAAAIAARASVRILDFLGGAAEIVTVAWGPSEATLRIAAVTAPVAIGADAPSYRLEIEDHSTWFAPASPASPAEQAGEAQQPPGGASIDYLARDYDGLVAMMRSRVAQVVGQDSAWALDHPADPLTTMIEVLAYAGDHLAYRQDAAGTEAYLATARHRLSLRRHARLRDYEVDDGCNARTALVFAVSGDGLLPQGLQVVTLQPGTADVVAPAGPLAPSTTVFETMHAQRVSPRLNDLGLALAQSAAYAIAEGAVGLTLTGPNPGLVPGQLIVIRQRDAPAGATAAFGAQVLRLLRVEEVRDEEGAVSTRLAWHPEDRLRGTLTVPPHKAEGEVSVYGNVVLADHGMSVAAMIDPPFVPAAGEYRPRLVAEGLVLAAPSPRLAAAFDGTDDVVTASLMVESAAASLAPDSRQAVPCIAVAGTRPGMPGDSGKEIPAVADEWHARRDLLAASATERAFAVTPEDRSAGTDGRLRLRFGDAAFGYPPEPGTALTAVARIGGGQTGRVRADTLLQVVGPAPLVTSVTNPLPAWPSRPEETEAIRLFASTGFRANLRGIDPDDWQRLASADPLVETVNATVGEDGAPPCIVGVVTAAPQEVTFPIVEARLLEKAVLGAPAQIRQALDVQLDIALVVYCTARANLGAARERLQRRLGAGTLPDGSAAWTNPANWPLGRTVRLDELVAAIESDPAVTLVNTNVASDPRIVFRAVDRGDSTARNIERGYIAMAANELARFWGDPYQPLVRGIRLFLAAAL
jgi:hypothetical protein